MKGIVLCADDYGQGEGVSKGILTLLQNKRLTAVSCLTTATDWHKYAAWLQPFHVDTAIGLHLNFTEGTPCSPEFRKAYGLQFPGLGQLMLKSLLRRLKFGVIQAEINAQIDRFVLEMGFLPDYLDGHQHVHQFPIIRDAVIEVFLSRIKKGHIRLINPVFKLSDLIRQLKTYIIYAMGTKPFANQLRAAKIDYNQSFAGIYSFNTRVPYAALFPRFLAESKEGGLIMCHPAWGMDRGDLITARRQVEYDYLMSDQFLIDCGTANVQLNQW